MEIDMQQYLKNRLQFPPDQLAKHIGEWVAWSPDGSRIVASSRNPRRLGRYHSCCWRGPGTVYR